MGTLENWEGDGLEEALHGGLRGPLFGLPHHQVPQPPVGPG